MSLWWLISLLIIERLFELFLANRNRRSLMSKGGCECYPETYRFIVGLHLLFFVALVLESYPWNIPLDTLTWSLLSLLVLLQGLRYWCIHSLGEHWNTRIIVVPGGTVKKSGPYRLMKHPNYFVVTAEFIVIPMLFRAPVTMIVFSLINAIILRQRIRLEEQALEKFTDYKNRLSPQ